MESNFLKQTSEPLFSNLLWNRPVSARQAGRLLLVGGQAGSFSVPNDIYLSAIAGGIGQCQIAFPDSLQKTLGYTDAAIFVPSNPSGSLGKNSVASIIETAEEFDGIGVGGNLGNNSQTTVALESILTKVSVPVVIYDDALEVLRFTPDILARHPKRLLVLTMNELYKLAGRIKIALPAVKDGGAMAKIEAITAIKAATQADYLVFGKEVIVASQGQISLTNLGYIPEPAVVYGISAVLWLQNQIKPFEGLTTAAYILSQFDDQGIYTVTQAATKIRKIIDKY